MRNLTQRDVPASQGLPRWYGPLTIALAAVGLFIILVALAGGDGDWSQLSFGQGLVTISFAVLLGPMHQWPFARLGATILAAIAGVQLAAAVGNQPDAVAGWMYAIGAAALTVGGVKSLWRPRSVYPLHRGEAWSGASARGRALTVAGVMVGIIVASMLIVIFTGR